MSCDIQKKISTQSVNQGKLLINTKRIRELTQQIKSVTDCDSLKLIITEHAEELKQLAENAAKQQLEALQKILPILSLPGPNPISIVKWLAKLVTGTAYPQLEAYIKYTLQILQLLNAITELIIVVEQAIPKLKKCAIDLANELPQQLLNEITADITKAIDNEVDKLSKKINKQINDAICKIVNESAPNDILGTVSNILSIVDEVKTLKTNLTTAVTTTLDTIGQTQTLITGITGTVPPIDTSSPTNFATSISNGALDTLKSDTLTFVQAVPPTNTVLPAVTGTETTGSVLTCSTGTWTSDTTITYTYQWYRSGLIIDGAVAATYTPIIDDVESTLHCVVIGTNTGGAKEVRSNSTGYITYVPLPADKPVITGTPHSGSTLTCSTGNWPLTPTVYYYEWIRNSTTVVKAASSDNTYKVVSGDNGYPITCKVTASMFKYTLSVISDPTALVA